MVEECKFVLCQCGFCDEMIPAITTEGRPARFKLGHNGKKCGTVEEKRKAQIENSKRYARNHRDRINKCRQLCRLKKIDEYREKDRERYRTHRIGIRIINQQIQIKNREKYRKNRQALRQEIRLNLLHILSDGVKPSCSVCGFYDIKALQFDHISGGGRKELKTFSNHVSMMSYYIKHPEEAKQKLQILCANCNMLKHRINVGLSQVYQAQYTRNLRISLLKILANDDDMHIHCNACRCDDIRLLVIDHKNGGGIQELENLGNTHNVRRFYISNPEIARQRLQILCFNCNEIKRRVDNEFGQKFLNPLNLKPLLLTTTPTIVQPKTQT